MREVLTFASILRSSRVSTPLSDKFPNALRQHLVLTIFESSHFIRLARHFTSHSLVNSALLRAQDGMLNFFVEWTASFPPEKSTTIGTAHSLNFLARLVRDERESVFVPNGKTVKTNAKLHKHFNQAREWPAANELCANAPQPTEKCNELSKFLSRRLYQMANLSKSKPRKFICPGLYFVAHS